MQASWASPEIGSAKMRQREAVETLRKIVAVADKSQPSAAHLTLEWFTRERFLPMPEPQWAPSTRETNLCNIQRHILPSLGASSLSEIAVLTHRVQ